MLASGCGGIEGDPSSRKALLWMTAKGGWGLGICWVVDVLIGDVVEWMRSFAALRMTSSAVGARLEVEVDVIVPWMTG
jgi:hypothetical protein